MIGTTLIEIPSWGPASLIEIIWFATGVAVILFSTLGIPETVRLWTAAMAQEDAVMVTIAGGYVRRESIRAATGLVIALIGVYGCIAGPAIPGPVVVSPVGLVLTSGLLLIGFLIVAQSVFDRTQQRRVTHLLDSPSNTKGTP